MPIQNTRRVCGPYACDGQITQFPFDFKVFEGEQVAVQVGDALDRARSLTFGADYSVALNDDQDARPGGTVTLHTAYAQEYRVAIISDVPNTQPDTLINLGGFYPKVIERALDRLEVQIQQVDSIAQRSVRVPIFSNTKPDDLWLELKNDTREAKLARDEAQGSADSALKHARAAASSQQAAEASWSSAAWHSARAWKSQEQATASAAAAQGSADRAAVSERAAEQYQLAASNHEIKVSEDAAKALDYANEARFSAAAAKDSETAARAFSTAAKNHAQGSLDSLVMAASSRDAAKTFAAAAAKSETAAQGWADQAKASAALAGDCIPLSQKGAVNGVAGLDDSQRVPELNSRYPGVQRLPDGTDFDTCLTSDDYYIRTAGPNPPKGFMGFGLLRVRSYGDMTLQQLVQWNASAWQWWRMRLSSVGTWGPWRKVVAEGEAMRRVRLVGTTDANTLIEDNVNYAWSNSVVMGFNFPNIRGAGYLLSYHMAGDLFAQELTVLSTGRKPYCFHRFGNPQTNIWQPWRVTGAFSSPNSMPNWDAGDIYVDGIGWHRWNGTRYMAADALGPGQVLTAAPADTFALGPGQVLTDVTGSRALSVDYVNSTGRPIVVYVRGKATFAGSGGLIALQIGANNVDIYRSLPDTVIGTYMTVSAVIPSGETYRVHVTGGVALDFWKEYR